MKRDPLQDLRDEIHRENNFRYLAMLSFLQKGGTLKQWFNPKN